MQMTRVSHSQEFHNSEVSVDFAPADIRSTLRPSAAAVQKRRGGAEAPRCRRERLAACAGAACTHRAAVTALPGSQCVPHRQQHGQRGSPGIQLMGFKLSE